MLKLFEFRLFRFFLPKEIKASLIDLQNKKLTLQMMATILGRTPLGDVSTEQQMINKMKEDGLFMEEFNE